MARPSIAELEAILQREDEVEIEILPNGEVRAKNQTTPPRSVVAASRSPCGKLWAANTGGADGSGFSALAVISGSLGIISQTSSPTRPLTAGSTSRRPFSIGRSGVHRHGHLQQAIPSVMPKVTVITPAVKHAMHMYQGGYICYMHPNYWNPASHDLIYVLAQSAVWLNKHEMFMAKPVARALVGHTG